MENNIINQNEPEKIEKRRRKRRRFLSISPTNLTVRLLHKSKLHISKVVKELGRTYPEFATESAAVRHYVQIGIAAETATNELTTSLDDIFIQRALKKAAYNEIKPLNDNIKNLIELLAQTNAHNAAFFADISKRTEIIEAKLDNNFDTFGIKLEEQFKTLLKGLQNDLLMTEYNLKQTIILRSIMYIFLLGYKMNQIPSGEENFVLWGQIIKLAHDKANELSSTELKFLSDQTTPVESEKIRQMANEIFKAILPLKQPQGIPPSPPKK